MEQLHAYPWFSREFLSLLQVAAHMFGAPDAHCPIMTAAVAALADQRIRSLEVTSADLVLERMRQYVLEVLVNQKARIYDQAMLFGLFDWVERFGSPVKIQCLADVDNLMGQYCAAAVSETTIARPSPRDPSSASITLEEFQVEHAPLALSEFESILALAGLGSPPCEVDNGCSDKAVPQAASLPSAGVTPLVVTSPTHNEARGEWKAFRAESASSMVQ